MYILGFIMHLLQLYSSIENWVWICWESFWLELELASFCSCIVLLTFFLNKSLTSSADLPKQVGHNAATDIILSGSRDPSFSKNM